jgi:hypothetical protein
MAKPDENISYGAQELVEEIKSGEEQMPQVDVAADYERSKEFAVSESDRTDTDSKATDEAIAAQVEPSRFEEIQPESETSDPESFRSMAKEVNPLL